MAEIGRFLGGIGALIWDPEADAYLILRRAATKDFASGIWECVTGRVDQGEGFMEALRREVREELGIGVETAFFLGTTHFYRGAPVPENELIGVVFVCVTDDAQNIRLSAEHDALRWVTAVAAEEMLSQEHPSTRWLSRVIQQADALRRRMPPELLAFQRELDFELG